MPNPSFISRHRLALWLGVVLVCLVWGSARLAVGSWHADIEYLPILVVAGLGGLAGAAERRTGGAGWRLVGAAWLVSALGVTGWFADRIASMPAVGIAGTLLWNAYYPLMVAGLLLMAPRPSTPTARWRATVEGLTVGGACALLVYYFIGRHASVHQVDLVVNLLGETAVLVAAAVLISVERGEPSHRRLGAGALLATVADLSSSGAAEGSAQGVLSDLALCVSAFFVASAGLSRPGVRPRLNAPVEIALRGLGHLPSLSAFAVLVVLVLEAWGGRSDAIPVLAGGAAGVVALLLVSFASAHFVAEVEEDARAAQTERLAGAQRYVALGQLAGSALHDLKNMVAVLRSVADGLRSLRPVPEELHDLEGATARAQAICAEMLDLGKERPSQTTDLVDVVRGLESLLRRFVSRSVAVEFLTDGAIPVLADRAQLEMALVNLVANARDATAAGRIGVAAARRDVVAGDTYASRGVPPGRWACLSVRDTGAGMSAEVAASLFRPFFTTKGALGTGLGLAQVATFAERSGGHAAVISEPGAGTEVSVFLRLV